MELPNHESNPDRREFVKKAGAVLVGGLACAIPGAAGVAVLVDPLRRKSTEAQFVQLTTIDSLPLDGLPRKFSVVAGRSDAWNNTPHVPIGAVYLRRTGEKSVEALNVVCPHAGCFVDYLPGEKSFSCPCHNSRFGLDGTISGEKSPSPRPLDSLQVEIRNETEVWVKFQNFLAGKAEKIPIS